MKFDFKAEKMSDSRIVETTQIIENLTNDFYRDGFEHGYAEGFAAAQEEIKKKHIEVAINGDVAYFGTSSFKGFGTASDPIEIRKTEWYLGPPEGPIDGRNKKFAICHDEILVDSMFVTLNGMVLALTHDYYYRDGVITFCDAPHTGDWIQVRYSYYK